MSDYYSVLGVKIGATDLQIRQAYRKLALRYHPDKNQDNQSINFPKKFEELQTAYFTLSDPNKRKFYDRTLMKDSKVFKEMTAGPSTPTPKSQVSSETSFAELYSPPLPKSKVRAKMSRCRAGKTMNNSYESMMSFSSSSDDDLSDVFKGHSHDYLVGEFYRESHESFDCREYNYSGSVLDSGDRSKSNGRLRSRISGSTLSNDTLSTSDESEETVETLNIKEGDLDVNVTYINGRLVSKTVFHSTGPITDYF